MLISDTLYPNGEPGPEDNDDDDQPRINGAKEENSKNESPAQSQSSKTASKKQTSGNQIRPKSGEESKGMSRSERNKANDDRGSAIPPWGTAASAVNKDGNQMPRVAGKPKTKVPTATTTSKTNVTTSKANIKHTRSGTKKTTDKKKFVEDTDEEKVENQTDAESKNEN